MAYSGDFDSDFDDIPRNVLPFPPHFSVGNMLNIVTSPPEGEEVGGSGFPHLGVEEVLDLLLLLGQLNQIQV